MITSLALRLADHLKARMGTLPSSAIAPGARHLVMIAVEVSPRRDCGRLEGDECFGLSLRNCGLN